MKEIFGNGDKKQGREILLALALGLREKRQMRPVFAEGPYQALGEIGARYEQLAKAVEQKDFRQRGKALALAIALIRFLNDEHCPTGEDVCEE